MNTTATAEAERTTTQPDRLETAVELGMLATDATTVKKTLSNLLATAIQDQDPGVRAAAVNALGLIAFRARAAVQLARAIAATASTASTTTTTTANTTRPSASAQLLRARDLVSTKTAALLGLDSFHQHDVDQIAGAVEAASLDNDGLVRALATKAMSRIIDLVRFDALGWRGLRVLFHGLFDEDALVRSCARAGLWSIVERAWCDLRRRAS